MIVDRHASSALTLAGLLVGALVQLSTSAPFTPGAWGPNKTQEPLTSAGLTAPHGEGGRQQGGPRQAGPPAGDEEERGEKGGEEEDELFKDVDPRTLAAVLLQAMNKPEGEGQREGVGEGVKEAEEEEEEEEKEERAAEGADRDRDGRQELELVMAAAAAQGREEREKEEEEERKIAQEEEEKLTEKVTSRTTSQTVPVRKGQTATATDGGEAGGGGGGEGGEVMRKEVGAREEVQQEPSSQEEEEEEEQLSPEEVKNLESMMEEFQSYSTANKREREREMEREREKERERESLVQRESRGYSQDRDQGLLENEIGSKPNGYPLAMSKKKLKWQEETQKALNFPTFRGGNFMNDFDNGVAQRQPLSPPPPAEDQEMEDEEEDEEEEEEEEALSPEEEEARARAEQEEVRRQAAEAQRTKAEEEKLADIASDMLLQYMVKQDGGGRKYSDKNRKKALSFSDSNAAEDKRSDEEVVAGDDDDIDPQTIDKLIEISSRLHLPADDVVDIISDVEKKKKKDAPGGPEGAGSPWLRPLAVSGSVQNPAPKQAAPPVNPLKAWFREKVPIKPNKQELWVTKPPKSFHGPSMSYPSSYPSSYPFYPSYQKPFRGYYPVYFPPPKPPKSRYYAKSQAPLSLSDLLGNSLDYDLDFSPKKKYRTWAQPRLRRPPSPSSLRQNLYFSNYALPPHPRTFNPYPYPIPVPMPKPRSPSWVQGRRRPAYYHPPPAAPLVTREEDYYSQVGQRADSSEDLENYIQQVLRKRPRKFQ